MKQIHKITTSNKPRITKTQTKEYVERPEEYTQIQNYQKEKNMLRPEEKRRKEKRMGERET